MDGPSRHGDLNWCAVLEHHARRTPTKPLCSTADETVTYAEMAARSGALAGGLHERGVGAGDVVGLLAYNSVEFLETIFAVNHLGAIAMPINWRLAAPEVRYILEHSEARAFLCDVELLELGDAATAGMEAGLLRVCIADRGVIGWERLVDVRSATAAVPRAHARGDDVHRLMYTSGTTGRPKGVMITHANLAWKN